MISIAIATYNPIKEWLQQAIETSLLADEIVICNDGSHNFNENDYKLSPKVRIIHNDRNLGAFKAFSKAISECKGEWISAPSDDDYFVRDNFSLLLERLKVTRADIVYYPYRVVGKYNKIAGRMPLLNYRLIYLINKIYGASFFRRKVWEFLGGFRTDVAADWNFWLRAYKSGFKFEFFPRVCGCYRITERSMFEKQLKELNRHKINMIVRKDADKWNKKYSPA